MRTPEAESVTGALTDPPRLTKRQWELVCLVGGDGCSYKGAADEMGISVRTVQEYAGEIRDRCGIEADPKAVLFMLYRDHEDREGPTP